MSKIWEFRILSKECAKHYHEHKWGYHNSVVIYINCLPHWVFNHLGETLRSFRGYFQSRSTGKWRLSLNVYGTVPWARAHNWMKSRKIKKFNWTPASYLLTIMKWHNGITFLWFQCHAFSIKMDCTWELETKQNFF